MYSPEEWYSEAIVIYLNKVSFGWMRGARPFKTYLGRTRRPDGLFIAAARRREPGKLGQQQAEQQGQGRQLQHPQPDDQQAHQQQQTFGGHADEQLEQTMLVPLGMPHRLP